VSGPVLREGLIRDLAVVLKGALDPRTEMVPGPLLVAKRLRDVLGIQDGDSAARIAKRLAEALASEQPHYHSATGQENIPCTCAKPGTYARQAPNPLAGEVT
jgi:hypothetical protein